MQRSRLLVTSPAYAGLAPSNRLADHDVRHYRMIKRISMSFAWLVSGVVGTLLIPGILFLIAYATSGTQIGHYVTAACGFSFYSIVPIGFLFSVFIAISSFRWSVDSRVNQSEDPANQK